MWELRWRKRYFPVFGKRLKPYVIWFIKHFYPLRTTDSKFPDDFPINMTVKAHDLYILRFEEEHRFFWGPSIKTKGILYLNLYVLGRNKPIMLKVYDSRKQG